MQIAESAFYFTGKLSRKEDYGLASQLRRAAVTISANIAEGFSRRTPADKRKFYDYSKGSVYEVKSLLLYGQCVKYFTPEQVAPLFLQIEQVAQDINKINKSLS